MNIKFLKDTDQEVELEFENTTIPEVLRVYLGKNSDVSFVAWKRTHPSKNPILLVKTKSGSARKVVDEAVSAVIKDLEKLESDFNGLK